MKGETHMDDYIVELHVTMVAEAENRASYSMGEAIDLEN